MAIERRSIYFMGYKTSGVAPQNHSCDPNTQYSGLNVIAKKEIKKGEELTLNYTSFLNNEMESFICNCGAPNCKKVIQGKEENSITHLKKIRCDVNKFASIN